MGGLVEMMLKLHKELPKARRADGLRPDVGQGVDSPPEGSRI
jgi:hypothetical protein